jgi:ATP-dependent exoDNAse (exonuclease V) beta subunit
MKRDPDQQAAVDVSKNAVVSAGAGSGKTSVLTSRYLRLVLEERIPVREILALTFTRKAAAEMYERIYRALAEHADEPFVAEQLADFDSAVISTLDSFCSSVARNGCAQFGVPATFSVDERRLRERCESLALSFLVEHASEPVVADLIRLNRFGVLWKDGLASLAADHFLVSEHRPLSDYLPAQQRFLESELFRLERDIRGALDGIAALDPDGPKCIAAAQAVVASVDTERAFAPTGDGGRDAELVEASRSELAPLTKIALRCGRSSHPDVPLVKEYVKAIRDLVERYALAAETLGRWDDHERLAVLLERFRERVVTEKRRLALLSYHDVMGLAIRTLTDDTALRDYYKARFRAIMIDEFQDNNEEQKALLYLLSERPGTHSSGIPPATALSPSKLFFVGDEKQSIYRFRGADVSVFRMLADELSGPDADLRLGANYRSEPGLIRAFNELFSSVFADAQAEYEARFEPLRWRDPTPGVLPRLELWELEPRPQGDETYLTDVDAEAYHIASFIRSSVENGVLLVGQGTDSDSERLPGRPANYSDFAVLMRSSGNQIRLERMLRLFGIPYVSQAARSLFLEAPVNDIYQILQLALYPQDRVAYAGYLRSPLVGMSDEGIVRMLLSNAPPLQPCEALSDDDRRRVELARARYEEICALADSAPITELLHHIWYRWGYRYHLLRRSEYTPYLEYYDLFWELANTFEEAGLAAFLDEVRTHMGRNEKLEELEIVRGEEAGVQIMTIHKSKGLEFPVVIVANAGNRGRNDSVAAQPYYWSADRGLAFNTGVLPDDAVRERPANYLYTYELGEHQAQDLAERKRLLYVAATRAESHLVFSGVARDDERSLMGILTPAFNRTREALEHADDVSLRVESLEPVATEREQQAHRAGGRRSIPELAAAYGQLPVLDRSYPPVETTATALNQPAPDASDAGVPIAGDADASDRGAAHHGRSEAEREHPVDAIIAGHPELNLAGVFGSYCHWCIEHADQLGDGPPPARSLPAELRPDIPAAELDSLLRHGYDFARGFLESSLAARLNESASVEHEVPFIVDAGVVPLEEIGAGAVAGDARLIRGKIDLVAELADRVLVVDFKTDRVLDPEHYRVQMTVYRSAATELFGKDVEVQLFDLRHARSLPVRFDSSA